LQYNYTQNTSKAGYSLSGLRGQAILSSNVNETFVLNSDWITQDDYAFLNQLITSPEVYIYDDTTGNNTPIIITDNSYVFKTTFRDKLFNLTISYKYAFDTNLQNQ